MYKGQGFHPNNVHPKIQILIREIIQQQQSSRSKNEKNQQKVNQGVRSFVRIGKKSVYRKLGNEVVDFVQQNLGNDSPIKGKTKQDVMAFSIAPPESSLSNFWTKGRIHRGGDIDQERGHGLRTHR